MNRKRAITPARYAHINVHMLYNRIFVYCRVVQYLRLCNFCVLDSALVIYKGIADKCVWKHLRTNDWRLYCKIINPRINSVLQYHTYILVRCRMVGTEVYIMSRVMCLGCLWTLKYSDYGLVKLTDWCGSIGCVWYELIGLTYWTGHVISTIEDNVNKSENWLWGLSISGRSLAVMCRPHERAVYTYKLIWHLQLPQCEYYLLSIIWSIMCYIFPRSSNQDEVIRLLYAAVSQNKSDNTETTVADLHIFILILTSSRDS